MIVGIDPSLSATGIANGLDHWTVTTKPDDPARLDRLFTEVEAAVTHVDECELAVLENLLHSTQSAGATGMAHGVIRLALIRREIPYALVPPATLKLYATGSGKATKPDLRVAWLQRTGEDVRDDNEVDALWLRQIGLALVDDPSAIPLPATHRRALEKVTRP